MFESSTVPQEADLRLYLSRQQLADRLNCSERTIYRYERRGMSSTRLLGWKLRTAFFAPDVLRWLRGQPRLVKNFKEIRLVG